MVWLREIGPNLQLAVSVFDNQSVAAKTDTERAKSDSLHVVLRDESGKTLVDSINGLANERAAITGTAGVSGQIERTFYRLTIPRTLVGKAPSR